MYVYSDDKITTMKPLPGTGNQLNNGAEEKKRAVEKKASVSPVFPEKPVQNFEPLLSYKHACIYICQLYLNRLIVHTCVIC